MMSNQLPEGWEWKTLGEVCLPPQYGWTTSASHTGNLHLLRTTDITSGLINWETVPFCTQEPADAEKYLLQDGDIVISRAGSVGFSYLLNNPKPAIFASYLIRFRPLIYGKFVAFFLQSPSYWEAISEKSLGIAIPNVNATKLKQIPIPVPPLAEQERIVAKIEVLFSQLDAGVAALRRIQAALKRYKASVLKAACEGRLVGQDPTDEPAEALLRRLGKAPLVDDDLPALPEGWCWVRVGEVAEINPKDALIRTLPDSLPVSFVPMAAVDAYLGIVLNPEEQPLGKVRKGYTQFSNGDVLFAKITPCMENGKAAIAYDLLNNRGFGSTEFHVLRPCKAVNAQWLFHFIRQERFRSEAKAHFTGTAGQLRVPITFLSNYQMPLPPLIEQQRIVVEIEHRLSIIVEVESIVSALLARSARLRQAILKQAFEGKLV